MLEQAFAPVDAHLNTVLVVDQLVCDIEIEFMSHNLVSGVPATTLAQSNDLLLLDIACLESFCLSL